MYDINKNNLKITVLKEIYIVTSSLIRRKCQQQSHGKLKCSVACKYKYRQDYENREIIIQLMIKEHSNIQIATSKLTDWNVNILLLQKAREDTSTTQ